MTPRSTFSVPNRNLLMALKEAFFKSSKDVWSLFANFRLKMWQNSILVKTIHSDLVWETKIKTNLFNKYISYLDYNKIYCTFTNIKNTFQKIEIKSWTFFTHLPDFFRSFPTCWSLIWIYFLSCTVSVWTILT